MGLYEELKKEEFTICPLCKKEYPNGTLICDYCGYNLIEILTKTPQQLREESIQANQTKQQPSKPPVPTCPRCGSTAITAGARGVNGFLGFIGASKTVNRCANCGHTWTPRMK